MNKSQRIYQNTGATQTDKYITLQLEQDVEVLEFMSLNIYTKDAYQDFNADYGVLVGRVTANGGVGVPNAKISIFIPLTDTDSLDGTITSIYPYKTPRDKNAQGKRYNLLPRVAEYNQQTGTYKPNQPFGSFPIKPEIVTNQDFLDVYKKYYKYTALTNSAGDYMIFGVPVGLQTVHMSVDITDIGPYSMTPAAMVTNLGYSPNLFTNNNSKIKPSNDLGDLPNIETQEISVEIIPFWGDTTNFTIGITRQDFRIRATLVNTFTIFGSSFTDGSDAMWGEDTESGRNVDELYRARDDANTTVGMFSKRIGIISEQVYYYPANISDAQIDSGNVDPTTDMVLLSKTEYSSYKRDGDFVLLISCNRNKVITNELGNPVPVPNNSADGIFTEFRGFVVFEIDGQAIPMNFTGSIGDKTTLTPIRMKLKFPQYADIGNSFGVGPNQPVDPNTAQTVAWRKEHYKFQANKFYSVSRFQPTVLHISTNDDNNPTTQFFDRDVINVPYHLDPFWNTGIVVTGDYQNYINSTAQFPSNTVTDAGTPSFGSNWMNMSIYFPQTGYLGRGYAFVDYVRSATLVQYQFASGAGGSDNHNNSYYFGNNTQAIAAGQFNTIWMGRSDQHWTDFIEVPTKDIKAMAKVTSKGFNNNQLGTYTLQGKYRNGTYTPTGWSAPCPFAYDKLNGGLHQSGRLNGNPSAGADLNSYFYKGFNTSDCIQFLFELGLLS
jgi:hypothetical protein